MLGTSMGPSVLPPLEDSLYFGEVFPCVFVFVFDFVFVSVIPPIPTATFIVGCLAPVWALPP